jgi:hypothetical protein
MMSILLWDSTPDGDFDMYYSQPEDNRAFLITSPSNITVSRSDLKQLMYVSNGFGYHCCDGTDCGCRGISVRDYFEYLLEEDE